MIRFFEDQTKGKIANTYVFSTDYGQPRNKDSWKKPFKGAVKAAQLPASVVMYSLRHTAISKMIASGIDSFEVARMASMSPI